MSRHHPYGGSFEGPRRGGQSSGPGPDRSHNRSNDRGGGRGRGGGYGRGRGSGAPPANANNYPSANNYSQGAYAQGPLAGDLGSYGSYDASSQDPYYQNGTYGASPSQYGSSAPNPNGYGYNNSYEDDASGYNDGGDYGGRGGAAKRGGRRVAADDKVHDSIIEERIQRERPCRTLFIRNIKYETNSDDVRRQFEEHGAIKTFFDLISTRGMVFVTYHDLRAAERARDRLQGSEISGRPIDVHYSLPREDQKEQKLNLQGVLIVTLRNSVSGMPLDDNEVRRRFQMFGDVKSVELPPDGRLNTRHVEYYDMRACDDAFNRLNHQSFQDGVLEVEYGWEESDSNQSQPAPRREERDWEDSGRGGRGRNRGRGRGRGRGGHDDDDRRGFKDDRRPDRYGEDQGRGRGGGRGGHNDRFDRGGGYGNEYGGGRPHEPSYTERPPAPAYAPPPPTQSETDRFEQARKVQQLLAALKQPQNGGAPSAAAAPPAPPSTAAAAAPYGQSPATANAYYGAPPVAQTAYPGVPPPAPGGYSVMHGGAPQPAALPAPPSAVNALPPNIMALLQQTAAAQQPATQPQAYGLQPQAPAANGGQGYQQLMAYLQAQASQAGIARSG